MYESKKEEKDFSEELEDAVGKCAQDLYQEYPFKRVNVIALGADGFTYQSIKEVEESNDSGK